MSLFISVSVNFVVTYKIEVWMKIIRPSYFDDNTLKFNIDVFIKIFYFENINSI